MRWQGANTASAKSARSLSGRVGLDAQSPLDSHASLASATADSCSLGSTFGGIARLSQPVPACPQRNGLREWRPQMSRFSWRWWPRTRNKSLDDVRRSSEQFEGGDRRHLLQALSAMAGGGALAALSQPAEAKDASDL